MATLHHFKSQHEKAIKKEQIRDSQRNRVRQKYLSKMRNQEQITKHKKKKLKRLEEAELSVMDQLKNTTMIHNYMQSKFEEAFWPGLSISTNLGSNSHRSNNHDSSQKELDQDRDEVYKQLSQHESASMSMAHPQRNNINMLFSPSNNVKNINGLKLAPVTKSTNHSKLQNIRQNNREQG
jgi:hypothetical protein